MPHLAGSATQAARDQLNATIERTRADGMHRLPTLDQLARAAGVSRMTMWHAVREQAAQSAILVRRRQGIVLADPSPRSMAPPPNPRQSAAERACAISNAIA